MIQCGGTAGPKSYAKGDAYGPSTDELCNYMPVYGQINRQAYYSHMIRVGIPEKYYEFSLHLIFYFQQHCL